MIMIKYYLLCCFYEKLALLSYILSPVSPPSTILSSTSPPDPPRSTPLCFSFKRAALRKKTTNHKKQNTIRQGKTSHIKAG